MRAAIAIGSNSTRMLAAEKKNGTLANLLRGREETRLFLGMDDAGRILPERIESTAQAVNRLFHQAAQHGARETALFATSAMRDAINGEELAERIRALCGLPLQVISGEEEARLAFAAAAGNVRSLVMDIGGGSTELTIGEQGKAAWAGSAQLGASRLMKACPVRSRADAERALALARETLRPFTDQLKRFPPALRLVGLGGSCTTSAAMLLGREAHGEEIEGYRVRLKDARDQLALLAPMTVAERRQVPGLPASRAEHIPNGLCILIAAMEESGFEEMRVSIRTNLDGFLLSLPDEERTGG